MAVTAAPPRVLIVGDPRGSFDVIEPDYFGHDTKVRYVPDLPGALAWLQDSPATDLVVVVQDVPGRYGHQSIAALRRAAPLAGIVALLGPWCEGESRTGRPWPAAARVYWHQLPHELGDNGERAETTPIAARFASWRATFPLGDDDRLLLEVASRPPRPAPLAGSHGAVLGPDRALNDLLFAALTRAGAEISAHFELPNTPDPRVEFVVWDLPQFAALAALAELPATAAPAFPRASVVALANFPRPEDVETLRAAGVAACLSKPLRVDELIDAVLGNSARRTVTSAARPFKTGHPARHAPRSARSRAATPARVRAKRESA